MRVVSISGPSFQGLGTIREPFNTFEIYEEI